MYIYVVDGWVVCGVGWLQRTDLKDLVIVQPEVNYY